MEPPFSHDGSHMKWNQSSLDWLFSSLHYSLHLIIMSMLMLHVVKTLSIH